MKVAIELSDGTVAMWDLDFAGLDTDVDTDQMEDETLADICAIIGDPDTVKV